jgi:hypothetical protein
MSTIYWWHVFYVYITFTCSRTLQVVKLTINKTAFSFFMFFLLLKWYLHFFHWLPINLQKKMYMFIHNHFRFKLILVITWTYTRQALNYTVNQIHAYACFWYSSWFSVLIDSSCMYFQSCFFVISVTPINVVSWFEYFATT